MRRNGRCWSAALREAGATAFRLLPTGLKLAENGSESSERERPGGSRFMPYLPHPLTHLRMLLEVHPGPVPRTPTGPDANRADTAATRLVARCERVVQASSAQRPSARLGAPTADANGLTAQGPPPAARPGHRSVGWGYSQTRFLYVASADSLWPCGVGS